MSEARAALDALTALCNRLPTFFAPPKPPFSEKVARKLEREVGSGSPPPAADLEQLRRRLVAHFAGLDPEPPSWRELRFAPWILWNGTPQGAEIPGLAEVLFAEARRSPRMLLRMIEAWLTDFRRDNPHIASGGRAIRALVLQSQDRLLQPWREADQALALFDAGAGPSRIAEALLDGPQAIAAVWEQSRLDEPQRAMAGYMRAVLLATLGGLPERLRRPAAEQVLARALAVLVRDGSLRFGDELRGPIARGLLAAWLDGGAEPDVALRDQVRDFLLRHLGDPRVRAGYWHPVGEEATALMRRWLASASLQAFFDLIDEFALDHQWRYRKAFWSAYLERRAIDDAWLALAGNIRAEARSIRDLRGAHGRLRGAGVLSNHSVLLLRLGPLVLCEWSHNGSLRAWRRDQGDAPPLYDREYLAHELRKPSLPFPNNPETGKGGSPDGEGLRHQGAERGLWQGCALELIAQHAGIRLSLRDVMPRVMSP